MSIAGRLRTLPLRLRLVAGFSAVMLMLLSVAGAVVYWRVEYALDRGLDTELASARSVITPLVGEDGAVASPDAANATGTGWQVLGPDGEVLDSGGATPARSLLPVSDLRGGGTRTLDVGSMLPVEGATPFRVGVSALPGGGDAAYLVVGVRRDHRDEALRELLLQMSLAGLGALVVASVVGDQLARLALRPVERYRRRAAEIATGSSHLRLDVPADRDDEVTRLGHTLNEMLGALQESLDRERQFVGDASHELRTPLTLLRARIQLTRRRERTVAEHEAALDELIVDVDRLTGLAEQLLELDRESASSTPRAQASTDASTHAMSAGTDLTSVAQQEVARWHAAHPDRASDVVLEPSTGPVMVPVPVPVPADGHTHARIVTNLLGNALVHGAPPVRVVVSRDSSYAVLCVSDDGPGMSPDLLAQATRRFVRAPEARSRPGSGLGLALVEHLVSRAGGEVRLCHDGRHTSTGVPADLPCLHDARMTATVLLPLE